jgi:hypothetical protein
MTCQGYGLCLLSPCGAGPGEATRRTCGGAVCRLWRRSYADNAVTALEQLPRELRPKPQLTLVMGQVRCRAVGPSMIRISGACPLCLPIAGDREGRPVLAAAHLSMACCRRPRRRRGTTTDRRTSRPVAFWLSGSCRRRRPRTKRRGPQRSEDSRRPAGRCPALDLDRAGFGRLLPVLPPCGVQPGVPSAAIDNWGVLSAGGRRPAAAAVSMWPPLRLVAGLVD